MSLLKSFDNRNIILSQVNNHNYSEKNRNNPIMLSPRTNLINPSNKTEINQI